MPRAPARLWSSIDGEVAAPRARGQPGLRESYIELVERAVKADRRESNRVLMVQFVGDLRERLAEVGEAFHDEPAAAGVVRELLQTGRHAWAFQTDRVDHE